MCVYFKTLTSEAASGKVCDVDKRVSVDEGQPGSCILGSSLMWGFGHNTGPSIMGQISVRVLLNKRPHFGSRNLGILETGT